jgi:hypothetical protein
MSEYTVDTIEINYEMPFEGMLINAGVPKHQRNKIFEQLGSRDLEFRYKTRQSFCVENVLFEEPMCSLDAAKFIRATSTRDVKWNPFDIEHVLEYFPKNPRRFEKGFVFPTYRTFPVNVGTEENMIMVPHIFMMSLDKGRPDLELVKDNHKWAARTSSFPKYCRLKLAAS